MKYEVRAISIWTVFKVSFVLHTVFGFLMGVFYAISFIPMMQMMSKFGRFPGAFPVEDMPVGILMILFPIMFAIGGAFFGTLSSLILALLYNLVARLMGGLQLTLNPVEEATPAPPQRSVQGTNEVAAQPAPPPPPPMETPPPPPPVMQAPPEPTVAPTAPVEPQAPEAPDKPTSATEPGRDDNDNPQDNNRTI
jgi:hypothetical protein